MYDFFYGFKRVNNAIRCIEFADWKDIEWLFGDQNVAKQRAQLSNAVETRTENENHLNSSAQFQLTFCWKLESSTRIVINYSKQLNPYLKSNLRQQNLNRKNSKNIKYQK